VVFAFCKTGKMCYIIGEEKNQSLQGGSSGKTSPKAGIFKAKFPVGEVILEGVPLMGQCCGEGCPEGGLFVAEGGKR